MTVRKTTKFDSPGRARPARALLLAVLLLGSSSAARAEEGDAKSLLKAMADYVGSQKAIEFTFDSDIEIITPEVEKIQFTNSGEALLRRPDKLRAHRVAAMRTWRSTSTARPPASSARTSNGYAQFDAPGTVDQLIEALRAGHGVALPGADLLLHELL